MKILVLMRPGENDFYVRLAKKAYPNAEIITASDCKNLGTTWFGKYIYQKRKNESFFSSDVIEDIRLRCRFLRSIENEIAYSLINNLAFGLHHFFTDNKVDAVIGGLIDCYSQDVLERISRENRIPYIGFVGHFFDGYCRLSTRGELVKMPRKVSCEEIESVLDRVMADIFKPAFKLNRPKSINYMYYIFGRELVKKHIYFPMKKIIEQDFLNYHYNTVLPENWTVSSVINKDVNKLFDYINIIPTSAWDNCIYFPLHFVPEATVDYWVDNPQMALYEEAVLNIVQQTPSHIKLLIKEHPAMYMRRRIEFYEQLKSYNSVSLIYPHESSNSILAKVQNVAVFTGSVGVEALLRNKRVLTFTRNYYSSKHPNVFRTEKLSDDSLKTKLQKYPNDLFIHDILQGLFKARFFNDKSIQNSDIESMSRNFREYLTSIL